MCPIYIIGESYDKQKLDCTQTVWIVDIAAQKTQRLLIAYRKNKPHWVG